MDDKEIRRLLEMKTREANALWIEKSDKLFFAQEEELSAKLNYEMVGRLLDNFLEATVLLGIAEDPPDEVRELFSISTYVS